MVALTQDRNTPARQGDTFVDPVKAATTIYAGALVCLTAAGFLVPGSADNTLVARGRADEQVANPGADGAQTCRVRKGVFRFANSAAADAITRAEIGDDCYVVDDQTVAKTNGAGARPVAGKIEDVDAAGVWVRFE